VGPCRHGMAIPQVADGGTATSMDGSSEYIEQAVANRRQDVVLQNVALVSKRIHVPRAWTDTLVRLKLWKRTRDFFHGTLEACRRHGQIRQ